MWCFPIGSLLLRWKRLIWKYWNFCGLNFCAELDKQQISRRHLLNHEYYEKNCLLYFKNVEMVPCIYISAYSVHYLYYTESVPSDLEAEHLILLPTRRHCFITSDVLPFLTLFQYVFTRIFFIPRFIAVVQLFELELRLLFSSSVRF